MHDKKLIIIAGASGGIGKAFLAEYKKQFNTFTFGINRSGTTGNKLDLMDANAAYHFVKDLDLTEIKNVTYMHAIGIDKFEPTGKPHIDYDGDGIDDEVLSSNYMAFLHLAEPLIEKIKQSNTPLTICNIGSISDVFEVPYWQSFTRAKNKVRQFCKSISKEGIHNIVLNVSSTLDDKGNTYGRKNIDITYWQTTQELVNKSFHLLDQFDQMTCQYAEFDFFKCNPTYRPDYFTNLPALYANWQRDLGFSGQEVPLGIRI